MNTNYRQLTRSTSNRMIAGVCAGLGDYQMVAGRRVFVPASVSFHDCSDDEMREFVRDAETFLRSARATRKLWPHLKAGQRTEMVETLLHNPNEEPSE